MYELGIKPFKVGTKIKINEELTLSMSSSSSFGIAPEMLIYTGKTAIITKVIPKYLYKNKEKRYGYKIDLDNETYLWGIDMFREIKTILELE